MCHTTHSLIATPEDVPESLNRNALVAIGQLPREMGQQRVVLARLRHRLVLLALYSYPRIARPNHEVPAVPVQKRTVEDLVADLQI